MTGETAQQLRTLLLPSDDIRWDREVMALNPAETVPILIRILNDSQEADVTRQIAATILGMFRSEQAVGALAEALESGQRVLRARAAAALGQFGKLDKKIVQRLIDGLEDEEYFFRESCAKALARLKCAEALTALAHMSTADTVSTNRDVALRAIEEIRRGA